MRTHYFGDLTFSQALESGHHLLLTLHVLGKMNIWIFIVPYSMNSNFSNCTPDFSSGKTIRPKPHLHTQDIQYQNQNVVMKSLGAVNRAFDFAVMIKDEPLSWG